MTIYCNIFLLSWCIFMMPAYANSHHPQHFLQSIKGSKQEGQDIYQHFCAHCHAIKPMIPLGAPRIEEAQDWHFRLKQSTELLFKHTDEGLNAMPPRGGCFECTDRQLILAMVALLPKKNKKALLNSLLDYKKIKE